MRLIERLLNLQESHGYLTDESLRQLAHESNVPLYRIQELVSFYPHFRRTPPRTTEIAVCRDMACWLADPNAAARLRSQHAAGSNVDVREVSCLGRCDQAPAIVEEQHHKPKSNGTILSADSPYRCDPYPAVESRFAVLREYSQASREQAANRLIATLKESGLRGMGGAGFPTGTKWEFVRRESRTPKYVICNADESEPGTFKDRVILTDLPHLVIEGMILGGLAVGATRGILFIRHEYEAPRHAFEAELQRARSLGIVGGDFDIEVFVSPGGYILGEETALLECLEDKRGEPRNKPPFPGSHGLHGQPTLINNVETFAMVPSIARNGSDWWKAQGKPGFAGLKFMAVSGHVEKPGVYEISVGSSVRELIERAGGMKDGRKLLAFTPGGASSPFLPAFAIDTPLDFTATAKAGSMLGSGALFVVAEGTDLMALGANVVRFFRNESCGKCVPCRLGSQQAVNVLDEVQTGRAPRTALDVLPDLNEAMALTSICGLGQVALTPILSLMPLAASRST